jgi:hypothetical protein
MVFPSSLPSFQFARFPARVGFGFVWVLPDNLPVELRSSAAI